MSQWNRKSCCLSACVLRRLSLFQIFCHAQFIILQKPENHGKNPLAKFLFQIIQFVLLCNDLRIHKIFLDFTLDNNLTQL